jgi:cytochrome c-type biogenesis protein CcmH
MLRLLGLVLVALLLPAAAVAADTPLADANLERRALALNKELRCLVCQNQSIAESSAELAADLRRLVRERIAAGDSDAAVRTYLAARYGDWVLLAPPLKRETWLLWFGPAALLLLAALGLSAWYRRRQPAPAPPLDADERRRLRALLADEE